jgi:hypothetical protein
MITTTSPRLTQPRDLISPGLFDRLALRVADDENTDPATAARIVGQALAFLAACAANPETRLAPSELVDAGWHAFILHTADYAEFCDKIAGRFLHHAPTAPGDDAGPEAVGAAIEAMRAAALPVDTALWVPAAKCSQCYAGCTSDPRGN